MKRITFTILLTAFAFMCYSQVTVSLPTITSTPGSTISVPVTLSGASSSGTPISAADIRINFNTTVLTFTGISNFYSSMPANQWFYSGSNTTGLVSANWIEPNLLTLSVPDDTPLFYINFTYNSGSCNLTYAFTEFTDASYNTIPVNQITGSVGPDSKTLNLIVFLEGLFNGVGLNKSQGDGGDQFPGIVAEEITVELHNSSSYSVIEYTATNVPLSIYGTALLSIPSTLNNSYYITIKTRNSIETTTATPVSFAGATVSYNFTDVASKAFGDNQVLIGGLYCLFSGDANADGLVDSSDMINVDNLASAFGTGYLPEDVNGDGLIDSSDMIIVDNNATLFISAILP